MTQPDTSVCDAPGGGGHYMFPDGSVGCRCIVCGRCGHHTGNTSQGHYWSFCSVTRRVETFHFCCPDRCELHPGDNDPPEATNG